MQQNLDILADLIGDWAQARNLIDGATMKDQLTKLFEEGGELAGGIARKQPDKIKDGIGDCFVVLTILALQAGTNIHQCVALAYDEIKDRRGKMVDGVFVKGAE